MMGNFHHKQTPFSSLQLDRRIGLNRLANSRADLEACSSARTTEGLAAAMKAAS